MTVFGLQAFEEFCKLNAEQGARGHYVSYRFWCRLLGAVDKSYVLAMSAGGDKVVFQYIFSPSAPGVQEFLDGIWAVGKQFQARPHLGLTLREKDMDYTAWIYGSFLGGLPWLEFEALRQTMDPEGKFLNEALRTFITKASVGGCQGWSCEGQARLGRCDYVQPAEAGGLMRGAHPRQ